MPNEMDIWADKIGYMITHEALLFKITLGVIVLMSLFYLLRSWRNMHKRDWESLYYIFLCLSVLVWSGVELLHLVFASVPIVQQLYPLAQIGTFVLPGLLFLHVWRQVSYKEITSGVQIGVFVFPLGRIVCLLMELIAPGLLPQWTIPGEFLWYDAIFYIYVIVLVVKSYLLCFNVFYQMPPHMRRSARYLLTGITMVLIDFVARLIFGPMLSLAVSIGAMGVLLVCFNDAFSVANSSNVIVTSREFVFGSLSTMILVLSRKNRILDWNKKEKADIMPLPTPVYKEPFQHYRERMLRDGNGRVSPHGDNIITTMQEDGERHYLITTHEVGSKKRRFGYIVEISEVSSIYSVLRYLEEIAIIDQLTGIYNRNAYLGMVHRILQPENMPLLVLVGDVNNLKKINDTLGHLCGDELLTTVSGIISDFAPQNAFAARIGGDEFTLLVPCGNTTMARNFIAETQRECESYQSPNYGTPSISWGYAIMETVEEEYNEVFARADTMMYETKRKHFHFRSSGFVPSQASPEQPAEGQPPEASAPAPAGGALPPMRNQPGSPPPVRQSTRESEAVAAAYLKMAESNARMADAAAPPQQSPPEFLPHTGEGE